MRRRTVVTSLLVAPVAGAATGRAAAASSAAHAGPAARRPHGRLTNLAHLDFLRDEVTPPACSGHSTYGPAGQPVGVVWTYAEPDPDHPDGSYRRVGGGSYDAATGTWSQGAFNADDMARAAVVYVRQYRADGERHSLHAARALLRGLTYLQTTDGPDAGNVVLWMQPDGTLNRSADPPEEPDPSDSAPSYWLARTVWALGEGYAALRGRDPDFARFLRGRLDLALDALDRQLLQPHYGEHDVVDGHRTPAWLIADGADATAEAVLGLAAYVEAGGGDKARRALHRFARGIAGQSAGDARTWPFGAVLPWTHSRTMWHGWGGQAPAALARAAAALGEDSLLRPALADTASFTPHLLIAGGPDNGWLPTPVDRSQIAYGADSRVRGLLAVADAAGRTGLREVAATAAAWFFGANRAGVPVYDPATGRTFDGIAGDGTVNRNSGAESTIHGLLTMQALDADARVRRAARVAAVAGRQTWQVVEAEDAEPAGDARVVTPSPAWTGESQWSGSGGVSLGAGGSLRVHVGADKQDRLVLPVVFRGEGDSPARTRWSAGGRTLGVVGHGGAGQQGISPVPGVLEMVTLPGLLPAGTDEVRVAAEGGARARVDAVVVQPEVEHLVLTDGAEAGRALLRSFADDARTVAVTVPGRGAAHVAAYDGQGRLVSRTRSTARRVRVAVPPGGFAVVDR
ncbi:MAG TPA: hypothetical protein VFH77_07810 [Streptomyces sp.]|nr:hypothetical protein [Streptomyces sp.]